MNDCPICGHKHPETPAECGEKTRKIIQDQLAMTFATLLESTGDTRHTKFMICNYTLGYMGAQYGLHIS